MKLFNSYNKDIDIFIKIGEKCPTACESCYYAHAKGSFFDYPLLLQNISYMVANTPNTFGFFLYGVDTILYPHLESLLDYILEKNRKITIQLNYDNFGEVYKNKILLLQKKFVNIEFIISKMLSGKEDLLLLIRSMRFFLKHKNLKIKYDLIIDFKKDVYIYDMLKEKLPNLHFNNLHKIYNFHFNNVYGSIGKKIEIDNEKKCIENIDYTKCIMVDYYSIVSSTIYLEDSLEIDVSGDFRIHTNLCFLGDIKISNKKFGQKKIVSDFYKWKKIVNQKEISNMKNTCFRCIKSNYSY